MRSARISKAFPALVAAAVILLGACSGGSDSGSPFGQAAQSSGAGSGDVVELPRPARLAALPAVELVAPGNGRAGSYPVFTWGQVPGAALYVLSVIDEAGPVWSWHGDGTEIRIGGYENEPAPDFGGMRLERGAWWSVIALDGSGGLVAASAQRAVSPDGSAPEWNPGRTATFAEPVAGDTTAPQTACGLLTQADAEAYLGTTLDKPTEMERRGGDYTSCDWEHPDDEFANVGVSVNRAAESWDPAKWTRKPMPIEGIGEDAFAAVDWGGTRIGILRGEYVVYVTSGYGSSRLDDTIALARLVDERLAAW